MIWCMCVNERDDGERKRKEGGGHKSGDFIRQ